MGCDRAAPAAPAQAWSSALLAHAGDHERDLLRPARWHRVAKTVDAGCSEHEALHAAEMVGRLLDQYNHSMDEIDIREEVCVLGEVPAGSRRRMPIDGAVVPIARFCDVKTWHAKRPDETAVYCFYGFEPDVAMAVHLFTVVAAAVRAEAASFKGSKPYAAAGNRWLATASFQRGLVDR